jgi:hypothetical protein
MKLALGPALLALCVLGPDALAQSLDRGLLGNGGRVSTGGGQMVIGTIGQPAVGGSTGTDNVVCHGWWCVERGTLVAVQDPALPAPQVTTLDHPRPNPARGSVVLAFALARAGRVEISVHDVTGARVATPVAGVLPAGRHEARWDGTGRRGDRFPAGVYFVSFTAEGRLAGRRRIALLR